MTKTVNSLLQNFQIMNGLTTIVNDNAKISDLLLDDIDSDTQTILGSSKTIIDYAVARGLASIDVVKVGQYNSNREEDLDGGYDDNGDVQPGSVKFNYNQSYANTPTTTANMALYKIDLTYFYVYDSSAVNNYTPKSNSVLYNSGTITNAAYISEVNKVITFESQCLRLISNIMATQGIYN